MSRGDAFLELTLDLSEPIEIEDFARVFSGFGAQFDAFLKRHRPDLNGSARLYVKEVRSGSIVAQLWPLIAGLIMSMDNILIVSEFGAIFSRSLRVLIQGGRVEGATKSDLASVADMIKAVAHDKDGTARITRVSFNEDGQSRELVAEFGTLEARRALLAIEEQRNAIEAEAHADHERVLMVFERSSISGVELGKRSGERVVIEEISPKPHPLIYASDLAERRIKSEIRDSDDNIFKKAFVVDVNVQMRNGRPFAYRVVNVHQVLDIEAE